MLSQPATLKQAILLVILTCVLFLACCWHKTLVGFLIVVPLVVLILGIPCVIVIWALRLKGFFKPPTRRED